MQLKMVAKTKMAAILALSCLVGLSGSLSVPNQHDLSKRDLGDQGSNLKQLLLNQKSAAATATATQSQQVVAQSNSNVNMTSSNASVSSLNDTSYDLTSSSTYPNSAVSQSIMTFLAVFMVGCSALLAVYGWKKYTQSSYRYFGIWICR